MPEILTESFCERCGTRYTFESAAPRAAKLKGIKVLSRGLKNFVMSDDTSMDEAMAAARSETDRELTSQQLDAFHKTFNFCMSCRQYTCGNCWNEVEGRCLSCAPHLGNEIMPAPFPDLDPAAGLAHAGNGANGHAHEEPAAALSWPAMDLERDLLAEAEGADSDDLSDLEPIDAAARLAALGATDDVEAEVPPPVDVEDGATDAVATAGLEPVTTADAAVDVAPDLAPDEELTVDAIAAEPEPDGPARLDATVEDAPDAVVETPAVADVDVAAIDESTTAVIDEQAVPALADTEPAPEPVHAAADTEAPAAEDAPELADGSPVVADDDTVDAPTLAAIDPTDVDGRATVAASQTNALLRRFRPGQSLDAELDAYEREHEVPADTTPAEPVAALDPTPLGTAAEAEAADAGTTADDAGPDVAPEQLADLPTADPQPLAAAVEWPGDTPMAEPATVPDDVIPQPTWRIVAPDPTMAPPSSIPGTPPRPDPAPPPAAASGEPQWPARPEWPSHRPAAGLPFLDRPAQPTGGLEALWAESAREVVAAPPSAPLTLGGAPARPAAGGVQPCVSCGLSLSATARFCRRCGTRQG